ncbi:DUF3107 domain-containing protein [Alloscardovia criceti]|uniref:DUF3107 domain-containing protein n=1 Tax=Alloscardovia criceti TaxID=356828 RepID=UPI000363A561|nr:DUF3107 domain-containing protein [Alloscardovia criceti]
MLVEIGVQNVGKALTFETKESAQDVSAKINEAISAQRTLELTDEKGRTFVVPVTTLAYAIVGSESTHPVGFGAL